MDKKLIEEVQAMAIEPTSLVCRAKFLNSVPPQEGYPVIITKIVAGFTYSDGTTSTDRNINVRIEHNEARYLYSKNKCVKEVYGFLVYEYRGSSGTADLTYDDAPQGQCYGEVLFELAPARFIPEGNKDELPVTVLRHGQAII